MGWASALPSGTVSCSQQAPSSVAPQFTRHHAEMLAKPFCEMRRVLETPAESDIGDTCGPMRRARQIPGRLLQPLEYDVLHRPDPLSLEQLVQRPARDPQFMRDIIRRKFAVVEAGLDDGTRPGKGYVHGRSLMQPVTGKWLAGTGGKQVDDVFHRDRQIVL